MTKTYIIPNIHKGLSNFTKDGRTSEEVLSQSGDVMKENSSYRLSSTTDSQRDDITSEDTKIIKLAKEMREFNGSNSYPGYMPIRKAMYSSPGLAYNGGGNVAMTPPQFYSPIHTPTNWQIPTKRREVYMWTCPVDFAELTSFDYTIKKGLPNFLIDDVIQDTVTNGKVYSIESGDRIICGNGSDVVPSKLFIKEDIEENYYEFSFHGTNHKVHLHENHDIFVLSHEGKNGYFKKYRRFVEKKRYEGNRGGHNFREYAEKESWIIDKKQSKNIEKKDWGLIPLCEFKNKYKEYSEDFFYLVGLLLADGFKTYSDSDKKNGTGIGITFNKEEDVNINFVRELLKNLYPNNVVFERPNPPSEKCISLRIKSVDCFNDFDKFVDGTYDKKKIKIPFSDLNKNQVLKLIAGYFDGDGCYNSKYDLLQIPSISKDLSNQIYFACINSGICANIFESKVPNSWKKFGKTSTETFFTVTIQPCSLDIISPYVLSKKIPQRQYKRDIYYLKNGFYLKDENNVCYFARRIKKIKKFKYTGKSFDFEINPDPSYCVGGFKVSNCRFFSNNNATINSSLRFYSEFPFTNYEHMMTNPVRKEHFDKLRERLGLQQIIPQIAWEYFSMGDAFPFVSIDCPECSGWGKKKDGSPCNHEHGRIGVVTVLNPDLVDVKTSPINPNIKSISLVPDETLVSIVNSKKPKEIYDMIPDNIKVLIASKQPIPLNSKSVCHLKHRDIPYITYGTSMLTPLFPILAYLDRLRQAQWIVAERHILPIKICKVGNDQRPAGPQDIADVRAQLAATANDPNLTLVVHHAFCHDIETEVLTESGWKKYTEVNDNEKIMVFDKENEKIYFDNFEKKYEFDYDGEMILFKNSNTDICVTPNHEMLYLDEKDNEWKVDIAENIEKKEKVYLRSFETEKLKDFNNEIYLINKDQIKREKYKGMVWCFGTKTGFFVTRRNGKVTIQHNSFEWVGSSGRVLQLTKEYDLIDKEIIKGMGVNEALLSGQGPSYCFPQDSRILTSDGFKNLEEFDKEKHLVATLNPDTHKFEWGKATDVFVFDHDSIDGEDEPLIHFKTKGKVDCIVTRNHEMYVKQNLGRKLDTKYTKVLASEVKDRSKFILKTEGWDGIIPSNIEELTNGIDLDTFLQLAAYFITEGSYLKYYPKKRMNDGELSYFHEDFNSICKTNGRTVANRKKIGISFSQNSNSDIIEEIFDLKKKLNNYGINLFETKYDKNISRGSERQEHYRFSISSIELSEKFNEYFGEYSYGKRIPNWIKDLPQEYLEKFIYHCVKCDGHERKIKNDKTIFNLTTVSEKLCEDYYEILLKSGNAPIISYRRYSEGKIKNKTNRHDLYEIYWSNTDHGNYPKITSQRGNNAFSDFEYSGKVWCVSVPPNHLILVERNGRAIWTGNSQAAIGIEATIKRLKNVQALFSKWIIEYIYKPEARMRGFYRQTKSGEAELDVPEIRWNDLNLRDETQKQNQTISLWEKQAVSTQTLHEKLGLDYDVEVERIRMEQQYQLQMGIVPKGKSKSGGLGGGFGGGGMGGGFGGGMGGNLPGGNDGPGLPGDDLAPSMSGGEGGDGAMEANEIQLMIQNFEDAKKVRPRVHRPKKFKLTEPKIPKAKPQQSFKQELYEERTGAVNLTELERILYSTIERGQKSNQLPMEFYWQRQPEPVKFPRIIVDGLFPDVKLIVQADGEQWHSSPKDIAKDQEIDARLASCGWTVLRFTEQELKNNAEAILAKIIQTYNELRDPRTANKTFNFEDVLKISSSDYIKMDFGKILYSKKTKENYNPEENIVEIVSNLAHKKFIDSIKDSDSEKINNLKIASTSLGEKIDISSSEYNDLPEDIKEKYYKNTILALDELCIALKDGKEINEKLHQSIAKEIYLETSKNNDWEDLDDHQKDEYLFYPKKSYEIISLKKGII